MESINYTHKGLISFQLNGGGMCYINKNDFSALLTLSLVIVFCLSFFFLIILSRYGLILL